MATKAPAETNSKMIKWAIHVCVHVFLGKHPVRQDHDDELHDLTAAVRRTKHRLNGAISLLMEALQELKDKGEER